MTRVGWFWVALSIVGALVLSALVWLAGPLVSIGDVQPFEGVVTRSLIILIILIVVFGSIAWRVIARRRAEAAIAQAMTESAAEESDAPVLKEKMEDALETLRRTGKSGINSLYDLPWYLIIGPPGAGKTTALVNSGLKFPLAADNQAKAVQGVGGTRYCDWWFTDEAVLIDTAGRYTTQDSDAKVDRKSWLSFLEMLARNRPKQPINGVIVAISIADVVTLHPEEAAAHADAIRKRLNELHEELKVDFPVYAVFTKMDLVVGFTQYFADLDEMKRQAVWGATFQTAQKADKKANQVGKVPEEIDLLIQRIADRMPERLQEEPDLRSRAILFGFPAQLSALRKPIGDFLNRIFEPTRYQTTATLRGLYLTSGTQEGTPFDTLIGALQKSYGVESYAAAGFSGVGKSFFLRDLMTKVIFQEAGWVSTNLAAVRRAFAVRATVFTLIAAATVGIVALWWMSYENNRALIAATAQGVTDYSNAAGPLIKQTSVTDPSLLPIYELIGSLPNLPEGYARRKDATPLDQTFGLSQRARLEDASVGMYQDALERLMRPRLILSLEQQIQKNIDNPAFVYEALKVYLMLGGKAPEVDKSLIVSWFTRDWEERAFPGAPYAEGRALLRAHLEAMLDMDQGNARKVSLNGPLVEQAQATLARMPVAERAYALLKSEAHNDGISDWVAADHGGPDMALVYEAANGAGLDTVRVRGFFTYDGFMTSLLGRMQTIAETLQKENWVLGASGDQAAVKQQYVSLFPGILALYSKDFISEWTAALNNLQLKSLLGGKPKYVSLAAASAPTSPIKLLYESIRDETALTRERPKAATNAATQQAKQDALRAGTNALNQFGAGSREAIDLAIKSQRKAGEPPAEVPGSTVEAYFKPDAILVDGASGSRPIDALIANLNELYRQLVLAAQDPSQAKQALQQVDVQVASLRANATRLPQPLSGQIDKVAKDAAGDATASNLAQISQDMAENVTSACQQVIPNRFPFARSDRDVPMADFAKLFAPNGTIDKFFAANLDPLVNHTGKVWVWKPNPARKLSETTLRQFQYAAEIRDAFFPSGGNVPNVSFDVRPLTLSSDAQTATLAINGTNVVAQQGTASFAPATVQWPGAGAGDASITMAPDMPDRKSNLERTGAWALFRLIDAGSAIQSGNSLKVSFVVFGREVSYQFTSSSLNNPLSLPALRQFKCPNGL